MASHSIWGFHFLLSCFMLLVLASVHPVLVDPQQCPQEPEPCGFLGNISFPFTTSDNSDCGFQIRGCDLEDQVKEIQLTDQEWYKIDSILNSYGYSYIIIHYPDFDALSAPWTLKKPFQIDNNITFSKCISNPTESTIHKPDMSLYRKCPYFDIYFSSSSKNGDPLPMSPFPLPMPSLPFACLLFQFLPLGQVTIPTCPSCTFLFSLLQIKLDLPKSCIHCHPPYFHPPSPGPEPKSKESKKTGVSSAGLSIGIPSAVAFLALVVILWLYKGRNRYKGLKNQPRSAYSASLRNTTIRESGALYFGIPVFSYEELQQATNNFDQARELGEGGFGTVYYGKLQDGREVAVKRLFERNYRPVESFINEIQILTRLRHQNLVTLYGCTSRHSRELLLVYEYIPNGTVSSHLHDDQAKPCQLTWPVRMKIAIETASALAYLHASDIIHRDVKTSNILLDSDFSVKVADFGLSRLFPDDVTHVSTAPRGTPGYVDPDYRLCYQLTTKSDVYSFGVVLVELISSLKAVDINRSRDDIKLANLAIRKIQKGAFCELVDPSLGFQSNEKLKRMVISVAELAFRCLQGDKELRPSMVEVLEVLQMIQSGRDEPGNLEGIEVHGTARATQSYAHPPLMRPHQRLHQTQ
ncbi:LEAF RUST 10 DISEASE-RESISTANCE LOCUS RECEPTOR-LIKE PROTEIN KINASE-like 1.2 [Cajanus cajan]|uniref:LEAF RUST 10 DISEASE-RESISTANCE LOCUS RECEPTOR-LIKE PROTEIN KINASE-like 1.2 n=1 Tax=Cajanus cajan TaxID=3821 RepID=UPI00098D9A5D|nr:LEAF RUST 10 DISEASE-RESISTANCE LOCUS RECEPTOR-LIKE PROTEIN KINASE-like 1.2 [Cajanus cajan]